ncbi:prenyltransferase/squalene oxidase repeat-containing protein [Candidatus Uabimicrobium amorphum]|uniref:Squalene cyclase C-terminal domain-containing protein n=1 Tax=Uabimicrobium amorphum TaxID=2596890 RepID=A0A5S9IP63_UABAM|nr:prenyltransferase/squalene oxidase repeat-containing protein [Candidatus Uabimicrobium amorphum]BBM85066.1 hypothetical protein UABAM_03429 [Candidatus Uabimicrobium amorphum]
MRILLCSILLANHLLLALSTNEAKTLISQAASFSSEDMTSAKQKPLSLLLLNLNLHLEKQINPDVVKDFSYFKIENIDRQEMLAAIRHERQNTYSFVYPQHIVKCEFKLDGNVASGQFTFEIKDLYRGTALFNAQRHDEKWRITSFTLPNYGLRVYHEQKKWQTACLPTRFVIVRFAQNAIYTSNWFESDMDNEQKICDLDNLKNCETWLKNFAQKSTRQKISQMKMVIHASKALWDKVKGFIALVAKHNIYKLYFTHDRKTIVQNYLPMDVGVSSSNHQTRPKIIIMVNNNVFSIGKNSFSGQENYKLLTAHLQSLLKPLSSSEIAFEIRASNETPYGNIVRILDLCRNTADGMQKTSVIKFSLYAPTTSDVEVHEEAIGIIEKIPIEKSKAVVEDPVIEDPVIEDPVLKEVEEDHYETFDESYAHDRLSDRPFGDNPFGGNSRIDAIGVGGGAGSFGALGSFGPHFGGKLPRITDDQRVKEIEEAICAGLTWLKNHQQADGSWKAATFSDFCKTTPCRGFGTEEMDTKVTALALLCLVNSEERTFAKLKLKRHARSAARYLCRLQSDEGCFDQKGYDYMHHHAIATLALCKLYQKIYSPVLRICIQKAVDFMIKAQNAESGWGHTSQSGRSNTSVTSWCVIALTEAAKTDFVVPRDFYSGVKKWLSATTDEHYSRTGYMQKGDTGPRLQNAPNFLPVETMTAAAICIRTALGMSRSENNNSAVLVESNLPTWKENDNRKSTIDYCYWFYGTVAMRHMKGDFWQKWRKALLPILLEKQCPNDCKKGSWPAIDAWSKAGGRVQATAFNTLSLQMFYR